jgi:DNA polymerase-3 subunit beta
MKATCNRERFLASFQTAAAVAPARSPKPILQNVKLVVRKDESVLLGTDLEIGVRCKVSGVEAKQPGEAILSTARVGPLLRELADEEIYIEADSSGALLRGQTSEFKLPSEDPAEFPSVPEFEAKAYHVVPARLLRELIRRTAFAADVESTRYALGGALIELDEKHIRMVGTDGRRLALMQGPASSQGGHATKGTSPVVPAKALGLVERSLQGDDTEVLMAIGANDVLVKSEQVTIWSRLVEGRFPKYQDVFPKAASSKAFLGAGTLLPVVRQAAIVTSEESRGVDFRFADGQLTLSTKAAEVGQSRIELPIEYEGNAVEITFDPRFLIDFLRVLEPETRVTAELIDSASAAVFRTEDGYSYVVMPLTRER